MLIAAAFGIVAVLGVWLSFATGARTARLDGVVVDDGTGALRAALYTGAADLPALHADQPVRLHCPGRRGGRGDAIGGSIVSVSPSPLAPADALALPTGLAARTAQAPLYRVVVRLDDACPADAVGTPIRADVRLARRSLVRWWTSPPRGPATGAP